METTRIIEQYLEGTLGREEKVLVADRLASDKDFKDLLNLHYEVNESIRDNELFELKQLIDKISAEYFRVNELPSKLPGKIRTMRTYILRIAAIFILVVASGAIVKFVFFNKASSEKLYQQFYETYDADIISRSMSTELMNLDKAIMSYSRRDYSGALSLLNEIIANNNQNYLAWFYRGLSCMETNQTMEAIISLQSIPDRWESPYREHRDWYLALALLNDGQIGEATGAFRAISSEGDYYAAKAEEIYLKLTR